MESKRINFNRPLISVRRFSPKLAGSRKEARRKNETSYKSEWYSGPLRNPGTVPFEWEQTPGRPKDETKTQKPHDVPNPPPGRIFKPIKQDFDDDDDGNGNDNGSENEKPQLTYGPNFIQFNGHDTDFDYDYDYDVHGNMSFKLCGLLPRFCLKGSIGIVNAAPEFSMKTTLPLSSASVGSSSVFASQIISEAHGVSEQVHTQKKGLVSFKELLAHEDEKEALTTEKPVDVDEVKEIDRDMITNTGFCKVDQKVKIGSEFVALPKSPSDSWLWRTLPSLNSKAASLWSNQKQCSTKLDKDV
ncbi:hypothetical protein R6Q59_006193 [Mikania micrantha]|uniref:Uncharacterized protein n=1 Tax=Mikania micrantha TaxID=192012 RepID=A0A5N6PXE8_9ASTR|nr:hypothetical protein E3N88_04498 [Mikania micrantha]